MSYEVFNGFISFEGVSIQADFRVPAGASLAEKDSAFLAALAQHVEFDYLPIGSSSHLLPVVSGSDSVGDESHSGA